MSDPLPDDAIAADGDDIADPVTDTTQPEPHYEDADAR